MEELKLTKEREQTVLILTPEQADEITQEEFEALEGVFAIGIETPMKTEAEILEAEDKLFKIVWQARSTIPRNGSIKDTIEANKKALKALLESCPEFRPKEHAANHIDGDKANNDISNLEWVTTRLREVSEEERVLSDFEYGMISGKLSALRWVTGDEWDMLDT